MRTAPTSVRRTPLGEIVVADGAPPQSFLFWTTRDTDGQLTPELRKSLMDLPVPSASSALASCHQVHGTKSVGVTRSGSAWCEEEGCDGLWTRERGVALAIKVADCLPVTMIDDDVTVVANVHAGWRGAAAGIVSSTLNNLDTDPSRLKVWLGPSIRQCCFEVGEEVIEAFRERLGDIERYVARSDRRGKNPHLDLVGLVARELENHEVPHERILDTGFCTRCPGSIFHSYRRSGANAGRNLAVAGLLDERELET